MGLIVTADLRRAGITDAEVRRQLRRGEWVRLRRGVLAEATHLAGLDAAGRHLLDTAAVVLALGRPGAVVGRHSAATLYGLPLPRSVDRTVALLDPAQNRTGEGYRIHRAPLPDGDVTRLRAIPVTTLPRTLVDLARTLPLTDAVVAADAALHRLPQLVTPELLRDAAGAAAGWSRAADARRLADLAVEHVESPLETRHRLGLIRSGVRLPRRGMRIDLDGEHFYPDGLWEEEGIVQESDGRVKTRDPWHGRSAEQKVWEEKRRAEKLTAAGLRFWRVAAEDLEPRAWSRAVERLVAMLALSPPGTRRYTAVFAPRPRSR
ncbi:Transcriptional regulator, AbiEi antitoxin, Type IV TA system [Klenkia marina]|uniref:Transcriptional regulator, AbiEi antitoxin, Type IV TA system n=2 Tax=Klenkia marina TaxID=1960309 RepID=A0A1G4YY48_9ACTN|nr:Transcriptional regulator, AbiEi antitoxin, Type IV TA system [Klenkia marina]